MYFRNCVSVFVAASGALLSVLGVKEWRIFDHLVPLCPLYYSEKEKNKNIRWSEEKYSFSLPGSLTSSHPIQSATIKRNKKVDKQEKSPQKNVDQEKDLRNKKVLAPDSKIWSSPRWIDLRWTPACCLLLKLYCSRLFILGSPSDFTFSLHWSTQCKFIHGMIDLLFWM